MFTHHEVALKLKVVDQARPLRAVLVSGPARAPTHARQVSFADRSREGGALARTA